MRLDGRNGDYNYNVYDAERCEVMRDVVWVDDGTNEYGTYGIWAGGDTIPTIAHKVRKIDIYVKRRLVIINPIEDSESEPVRAIATVPLFIES